jgi:hypothetical protein
LLLSTSSQLPTLSTSPFLKLHIPFSFLSYLLPVSSYFTCTERLSLRQQTSSVSLSQLPKQRLTQFPPPRCLAPATTVPPALVARFPSSCRLSSQSGTPLSAGPRRSPSSMRDPTLGNRPGWSSGQPCWPASRRSAAASRVSPTPPRTRTAAGMRKQATHTRKAVFRRLFSDSCSP